MDKKDTWTHTWTVGLLAIGGMRRKLKELKFKDKIINYLIQKDHFLSSEYIVYIKTDISIDVHILRSLINN